MIRKLAFALSLLGVCFTGFVHALGLGEAEVKSSLNQPLKAEIDLVNVKDLGVDEILPGLASREEFLKAGVDRVYFLSDIRFKVEKNASGELAVILTTNKPVREPFLNFLVEVIWPSGRLLREYALLIDPPVFTEQKAQPIQSPVSTTSSDLPSSAAPATVTRTQVQRGDVVSLSPTSVAQAPASRVEAGDSYGPTNANDTLWDIASKARPSRSVSPQQVMLAIQDLNPGAFIDQNINKLKTGQVLRLPTLDQIKQRSEYQAINEVIAQNEALRPVKRKAVVSASTVKAPQAPATKPVAAGDELKLVVSDTAASPVDSANSGDAKTGGASKATSEELAMTLEKLDKASSENKELSGRLEDLEGQLETLQRLLTLKNDQLANLQEQMQANELARLKEEQESQASSVVEGEEATDTSDMSADMAQKDAQSAEAETLVDAKADAANDEAIAVKDSAAEKATDAKVADVKATEKVETKPIKAADTKSASSDNYFDMIMSNPLYMAIGAAALLVLLIILWLVSRSNAQKEQSLHEEYAEDDQQYDAYEEDQQETDGEDDDQDDLGGDSFVAEEEDEVISQDEEEDPIAEADVYIAYGRLDQAAGILEEAISKDPVRTDYRLKLLEVYKESNDSASFDKQFSELEAIQDENAIEQASKLRSEMADNDLVSIEDLEQELVQEAQQPEESQAFNEEEVSIAAEEEAIEQEDNSFDFEPVEQADEVENELDVDLGSDELDVDLDIDLNVDETAESDALDEEPSFDASMLEDDFDTSALDEASDESLLAPESDKLDEVDDTLLEESLEAEGLGEVLEDVELESDLELESEIDLPDDLDLSEVVDSDAAASLELSDELMESADLGESVEPAVEEQEIGKAEDLVVSDDILEEAVDALSSDDELSADLGDDDDFDFLEGTDEASTKLDLARAYIDMGDVDGARDILEEVQAEGSDEQKAEATDLLNNLD